VAEPGQRRKLEAILSADVVGYSRLMQDDDAATVETLTKYRTIFSDFVNRHEGRIVDSPGDNILAEFDSPVEAVQSAIELQREFARRNRQLAEHRKMQFRIGINLGDILSRDDGTIYGDGVNVAARLESLAEPGGIMISESARMQVRSLIDVSIADAGEHEVKNIAEPVHVYRIVLDETAAKPQKPRKVSRALIATTAVAVLVIAIVAAVVFWPSGEPEDPVLAMPTGPTIAVLPFTNMSGDPKQEYFSDGITEDIITALSRFRGLYVLARNSTIKYKGQPVDVRQVGRDLGAQFIVEGSVRRAGEKIRVSAQLLDATDGKHLWAETYDRELTAADIFAVQDEIVAKVVAVIGGSSGVIARAERKRIRGKPPGRLDAYECVLGFWAYQQALVPDEHLRLRKCLKRALEQEPAYAEAWIALAAIYRHEYSFGFNPQPGASPPLDRALVAAQQAALLDPSLGHLALALTHFSRHELDQFFIQAERALTLNPYDPNTFAIMGLYIGYTGRCERGVALARKAIALLPEHPGWYHFPLFFCYYDSREYDAALEEALKINMPGFFWSPSVLAAVYGQLERRAEAAAAVGNLLKIYPSFQSKVWDELRKWNFAPNLIEHFVEGLRKAGLDIPDEPPAAG
jgi:adenylate cyclase